MTDLSSLFHPIEPWHEEELLLIVSAKHCHGGDCCLFNLFLRHVMPCFSTFIFICHLFLGVIWGGSHLGRRRTYNSAEAVKEVLQSPESLSCMI